MGVICLQLVDLPAVQDLHLTNPINENAPKRVVLAGWNDCSQIDSVYYPF